MVLKGSVNFGPRGSTALGFGGHAHRAFPISAYMSSSHKQFFKQRSGEYTLSDIGKQRYKEIKKGMF